MNTGSSVSASFLRKNHTFYHPTRGSNIRRQKLGSTPGPDRTKMSTLSNTTAFASEPCYNWVWKK
jgi:hypothetical protein